MEMTTETPSAEEQAKFYLSNSIGLVGYKATIETGLGDGYHAEPANDDFDAFVRNLEITFAEGVRKNMQNKREIGHSPVRAWQIVVDPEWPEWVKQSLAEQESNIFRGDYDFMDDEEIEYLDYLAEEYDVRK